MQKFLRDNGLTIVLMLLFAGSLAGQFFTGWHVENRELAEHGAAALSLAAYATGDQFLSVLFENWESEFLQMSAYVVLTAYLFQRGSAESSDPDAPEQENDLAAEAMKPGAPALLRKGVAFRWLYAHSLGIALLLLFAGSFVSHWWFSARDAAAVAAMHGETGETALAHLFSAQFWFESFQNWQSEFFSTAALVVLSIWLRQQGSPESKPVASPHSHTGAS